MHADCTFSDFGGSRTTLLVDSQASYVRCEFERNTLYTNTQGSALIEAEGATGTGFDTVVWLEDTRCVAPAVLCAVGLWKSRPLCLGCCKYLVGLPRPIVRLQVASCILPV